MIDVIPVKLWRHMCNLNVRYLKVFHNMNKGKQLIGAPLLYLHELT